jgi:hypothetical protein
MDVNDNACVLDIRVVLKSIASKLAPTRAKLDQRNGCPRVSGIRR